jgi:hypothetical protein
LPLNCAYCFFCAGSFASVDGDEAPPAGLEGEAPLAGLEGEAPLLEDEAPALGLELAPPEAEPDFGLSLEADPLDELGELGLAVAPPDGDEDELLLEGDEGDEGELDGEELELEDSLVVVLVLSPRSHAARPKASATATAKMESFMCPPGVGIRKESCKLRARRKPLMMKGPSRASGTLLPTVRKFLLARAGAARAARARGLLRRAVF